MLSLNMKSLPPYQRRIILALLALMLTVLMIKLIDRQRQAIGFDIEGFLDGYKYTARIDTSKAIVEASTNAVLPPGSKAESPGKSDMDALVRVNVNTVDVVKLQSLPGIGPVLAQRIVDYRDSIGHYINPDDLLNVSGIGKKKLAKMEQYLEF
ncbi:MAG: helix-hairpin-helix domain-containing protein [candidate division Zixibacteria bacterium]|nr:helix-hairpin-helix domain-containing protein [candidate division Zixibacteria bacterium]